MKLLVLGATGKTGQQVVARALEQGPEVTIFARTPERLGALASRVRTITGSLPEDGSALGAAMQGQARSSAHSEWGRRSSRTG